MAIVWVCEHRLWLCLSMTADMLSVVRRSVSILLSGLHFIMIILVLSTLEITLLFYPRIDWLS